MMEEIAESIISDIEQEPDELNSHFGKVSINKDLQSYNNTSMSNRQFGRNQFIGIESS